MRLLWIRSGGIAGTPPEWAVSAEFVDDPISGLSLLRQNSYSAVFATTPIGDWQAGELLDEIQRINASVPVVIQDAAVSLAEAVGLVKLGAFTVIGADSGFAESNQVLDQLRQQAASVTEEPNEEPWRRLLVGRSRALRKVAEVIRLIGPRKCTVLISGETGTGKELIARAIHMASPRAHLPMISVNCSALPENLLEAELFGHVKGAFTGAVTQRAGRFEQAHRSTIFLDEIGDMPVSIQAKLLRVLQEREFQRLGSSETLRVDVRIIAASNADLLERVRQGRFREDLYYRLNVVPLASPPLRERTTDIPLLVEHFIQKACEQENLPRKRIAPEAVEQLCGQPWPGNVRQLENTIEMAVALSGDRLFLQSSDLRLPPPPRKFLLPEDRAIVAVPEEGLDYEATVGRFELSLLEQALKRTGGNKKQAAEILRLKRTTLAAKLKSLEAVASC
ncbi:MAG: sigma-54-dependent Fis family transcriptional regulator [Bryobacteraceae bacterium]|nr:sigma-54 dependent transcriptional regulator [Bryobacterales bacterium]MEB2359785.1 sigma-54 dependent transcriptional regulator [Bryobacterales bacterium]NUM99756.1 sigma-54-dependent Fis family transcriptional regulator [Bryobacteraceae bacterium]